MAISGHSKDVALAHISPAKQNAHMAKTHDLLRT